MIFFWLVFVQLTRLQTETDAMEKEIIVKRKTLEMLPSAADNISKYSSIVLVVERLIMTIVIVFSNFAIDGMKVSCRLFAVAALLA
jgi:hypothetical protein